MTEPVRRPCFPATCTPVAWLMTVAMLLAMLCLPPFTAQAASLRDYLDQGERAYHEARYQDALSVWQAGLRAAREQGHTQAIGVFLNNMGIVYFELDQYEKALEHHRQALAISRETGDRRNEGNALGNMGNVYSKLGQAEQALEHYSQALAIGWGDIN